MLLESFPTCMVFPIPTGSILAEIVGFQCFYVHLEDDTKHQIVLSLAVLQTTYDYYNLSPNVPSLNN